jgi:hypothetical protein
MFLEQRYHQNQKQLPSFPLSELHTSLSLDCLKMSNISQNSFPCDILGTAILNSRDPILLLCEHSCERINLTSGNHNVLMGPDYLRVLSVGVKRKVIGTASAPPHFFYHFQKHFLVHGSLLGCCAV